MIRIVCLFFLMLSLQAGSLEESREIFVAIRNKSVPQEIKEELAQKVWKDPGNFDPRALLAAAAVFQERAELDKAAILLVGAEYRLLIDLHTFESTMDRDLSDLISDPLDDWIDDIWWKIRIEIYDNAREQFYEWDLATPRNYDVNWVFEQYETIDRYIEVGQKERDRSASLIRIQLRGDDVTDDPEFARLTGCSFDSATRIFRDHQWGFQFRVPENWKPKLYPELRYKLNWKGAKEERINLDRRSALDFSDQLSLLQEDTGSETIELSDGTKAIKSSPATYDDRRTQYIYFIRGHYFYSIRYDGKMPEEEVSQALEEILATLSFED